jgi:hypothetical protein
MLEKSGWHGLEVVYGCITQHVLKYLGKDKGLATTTCFPNLTRSPENVSIDISFILDLILP